MRDAIQKQRTMDAHCTSYSAAIPRVSGLTLTQMALEVQTILNSLGVFFILLCEVKLGHYSQDQLG